MTERLCLVAFLLLASFPAFSQSPAPSADSTEVQGLAPQLVLFAGSDQNFRSLVDGLAAGQPVTLVTQTADGFTQTATFTPVGTLTPLQIAQTLEAARQQLISRGIAAPTAQQIGITLAGGALPTTAGNVQVTGLVPVVNGSTPSSSAGASTGGALVGTNSGASIGTSGAAASSAVTTTTAPTGGVATQARPGTSPMIGAAAPSPSTAGATSAAPAPRFTSDTPTLGNLSNTPTPSIGAGAINTAPNGLPSPAAQIQQRR